MTAMRPPRPRPARPLAILGASILVVAATQILGVLRPTATAPEVARPDADRPSVDLGPVNPLEAPAAAPGSLAQVDRSISAWTANLAANDRDFLAAANLAALYEARARLGGDAADFSRAIEAAGRSLAIEPRQLDVRALHARLRLALHDFRAALSEAELLDRTVPGQPAILAIIADARLELGEVDAAESLYRRVQDLAPGPAVGARLARIAFLRGDPAGAIVAAERAFAAAEAEGLDGPQLSWYGSFAGLLSQLGGDPVAAAAWYERALDAWPASHVALAGSARAAASLGDVDAAIGAYREAIAIAPLPESLAALGDLLALRGDTAGAADQYATVRAIAKLQAAEASWRVFDRHVALFELDHGGDAVAALALAEGDLMERRDIYAYDAWAWALLANGRAAEADAAMAQALALGTRDARLLYHAGEIALAVGDADRARELLEAALGIEGALEPLAAARAAATLEALR